MNINFNGKILPSNQAIFDSQNRAFLYGDALFETIRMSEGKIPFLENHVNRLLQGLHFFKYKVPKKFTPAFFIKEIKKIATGNTRIRITVFRSSGGLYTPKNNRPQFLISTSPLSSPHFSLNKKGLNVGIFDEIKLPCSPISNIKTGNSSPYILAGLNKKERNLDDVILLNDKNRISEASSSNIFFVKKNKIITPSLSEGCIAGTMRKTILEIATEKKYLIQEAPIKLTLLQNFEEIWLTNAISGIKWVAQIDQNTSLPSPHHAQIFIESLNKF
jgi:branched-subunit amino acid aminotransferase/4-amino-4-deoxychorismate lyase